MSTHSRSLDCCPGSGRNRSACSGCGGRSSGTRPSSRRPSWPLAGHTGGPDRGSGALSVAPCFHHGHWPSYDLICTECFKFCVTTEALMQIRTDNWRSTDDQ